MKALLKAFFALFITIIMNAQTTIDQNLNNKETAIIRIASTTAKGDLVKLKEELNTGLNTGLTVNQIKEVIVHLYAYCGFPRSIRGLQTFMAVLEERKAKGGNRYFRKRSIANKRRHQQIQKRRECSG